MSTDSQLEEIVAGVVERDPHQTEFQQAAREVLESIVPLVEEHPEMQEARILERLLEPDRILRFRVTWEDDDGTVHVNRGWRVQHSSALGPYKGGLRFHRSVDVDVLKFLAFEQTFKNALTGLPLGAGKGGSDFSTKKRSDREVMRFCQSFMNELWRHVGPDVDVPAGDIGVGSREVGYLFGQYRKLRGGWPAGVLTGKSLALGGIPMRTEATGYGCVLFAQSMAEHRDRELGGARAVVSGAGNVSLHAVEKLLTLGVQVVAISDSGGLLRFPSGMTEAQLRTIKEGKLERRLTLEEVAGDLEKVQFEAGSKPWGETCDVVLPCATQNELDEDDARRLVSNGTWLVAEGANMPCTPGAIEVFQEDDNVSYAPGKASNAGGVAMSGLEMAQNAQRQPWTRERAEEALTAIMGRIHAACVEHGGDGERVDYARGANRAGFLRVARALLAQGLV